jgi:hypothetical protein
MSGKFLCKFFGENYGHAIFGDLEFGFGKGRADFYKGVLFEEDVEGFVVDLAGAEEEGGVGVGVGCLVVGCGVSVCGGGEEEGVDVIAYLAWEIQ